MAHDVDGSRLMFKFLNYIHSNVGKRLSAQSAQAFLQVALQEGRNLKEITLALDAKLSTVSRQLLDLGDSDRNGNPGYGLLDIRKDPLHAGVNRYYLSPRGRMVARDLAALALDHPTGTAEAS